MRIFALTLLVVGFPACSKKKTPEKPSVAAAETPAKPAPSASSRLVGVWQVDMAAVGQTPEMQALDPAARARSVKLAQKHLASLRFEFTADKTFKVLFAQSTQSGVYEVLQESAEELVLRTTQKKARAPRSDEVRVRFEGTGVILTGPDGKPVTFERIR